MNIFYLDHDPTQAARWLCDKHIVKMGLEAHTMLRCAHVARENRRCSWMNHPCSRWARESVANYNWLWQHMASIFMEYQWRYNRIHSYVTSGNVHNMEEPPPGPWPMIGLTPPHLGMPEASYVEKDGVVDSVESYRSYYILKYHTIKARWTMRSMPPWLLEAI
jgi:hypothetical protein